MQANDISANEYVKPTLEELGTLASFVKQGGPFEPPDGGGPIQIGDDLFYLASPS